MKLTVNRAEVRCARCATTQASTESPKGVFTVEGWASIAVSPPMQCVLLCPACRAKFDSFMQGVS